MVQATLPPSCPWLQYTLTTGYLLLQVGAGHLPLRGPWLAARTLRPLLCRPRAAAQHKLQLAGGRLGGCHTLHTAHGHAEIRRLLTRRREGSRILFDSVCCTVYTCVLAPAPLRSRVTLRLYFVFGSPIIAPLKPYSNPGIISAAVTPNTAPPKAVTRTTYNTAPAKSCNTLTATQTEQPQPVYGFRIQL